MNKRLLCAAATIVAIGIGTGATAASAKWDFEKDATDFRNSQKTPTDNNGMEGTFSQVYAGTASGGSSTKNGITLSASAYLDDNDDGIPDHTTATVTPFMDAYSAGLGVCKTGFDTSITNGFGGESQCSSGYDQVGSGTYAPGDDNLVDPEVLKLTFSVEVAIQELFVLNGKHVVEAGSILISTDNTFDMTTDLYTIGADGFVDLAGLASSTMFWFTSGTDDKPEIYLSTLTVSAVPVPAALPLLLAGLGGLGWIARRRKTV